MAETEFDRDITLSPEQYVIRELRLRLVAYRDVTSERTDFTRGMVAATRDAIRSLDDLIQSQGVTL